MFGEIKDETILKYDRQVPRYTSYPTAPHFSSEVNFKTYANWLENLSEDESLSLYIHIPFCQKMCWYCGCFTKITKRYAPIEDYVHILAREVKIVANLLKKKNRRVSHIHFGGGSPTILLPETFEYLMKIIQDEFEVEKEAEIAIEVDPRNVNEEKVKSYVKYGINRVSIGVQDFSDDVQKAINRQQSFDEVYEVIKLFREYGIDAINLDLVYGLPKQKIEGIKRNIDYAMLLKPSRIALFSYAHVPWMKKHMRLINEYELPDNEDKMLMYREASKRLEKLGYFAIGLDHFVKKNDSMFDAVKDEKVKRNFQGYSTDSADNIIAFGASAIGYLKDFGYVQNTLDFNDYKKAILAEELPIVKGIEVSEEDKMRKRIIDEIMCYLSVDLNKTCDSFKLAKDYFKNEILALEELRKDGLVRVKNNVIKINLIAPQIARVVASIFDKFATKGKGKHSKAM